MVKINQFAKKIGTSVRMLRHYDKIGLLIPESKINLTVIGITVRKT